MTRWMLPVQREQPHKRDPFDPAAEGLRHGLSREVSLALWQRAGAESEALDGLGRRDEAQVRERFRALAAWLAARGGRLAPDVGRVTRVGVELDGESLDAWNLDTRTVPTPGRDSLVAAMARRDESGDRAARRDETAGVTAMPAAAPSGHAAQRSTVEDYRARGLRAILDRVGQDHRLRRELITAACTPERTLTGRAASWPASPDPVMPSAGQALWHAVERHAATLYRRAVSSGVVDRFDSAVHAALQRRGSGDPLSPELRREMERELGVSLAGVRVHTDGVSARAARALSAAAFTLGEDIFFAEGAYAPDTRAGRTLLAHELTHVAQSLRGVTSSPRDGLRVSEPDEPLEQEASAVAARIDAGGDGGIGDEAAADVAGPRGARVPAMAQPAHRAAPRSPDVTTIYREPAAAGRPSTGAPATGAPTFSVSEFARKIADTAKKALFDEIKAKTGFDTDAGTFDGDLDINDAIRLVQVFGKLNNLLITGSNVVHLHIDFVGLSFLITADALHLSGIVNDATGFSCGSIDLSNVSIGATVAVPGTTVAIAADLHVGAAVIKSASFVEYQLGEPNPIKRLIADEVDLANIEAAGIDFVLSGNRWFARMKLSAGAIQGMHYPGLPPTNVAIVKAGFTLDSIHGAIGSGGDGPALPEAPDVGLPKDSHIDVVVDRGEAAMMERGSGISLKLFTATLLSADNRQLAKVEIKGFHAGKANDTSAAGASIDFVHFTGDPKFTQALLDSNLVRSKVDSALKVLESAGIKPSIGVDVTLTDIGVGNKAGTTTAKASLDASLDLGDLGQLRVALINFDTIIETAEVDAAFDRFTAALTKNGQAIASVELDGAGGKVTMAADGSPTGGAASTKFKVTGNLPQLIDTFNQALPKLPRSVRKIVPIIKALKVDATVSGSVSASKDESGDIKVNGDLDVTITAAANTTATISLHGFRTDKDGAITRASFHSFSATLKTVDGKEAASLSASGVHGWVADDNSKSMNIPSLTFKGNGANIGILAAAISKKAASLPPGIKDVCNLVAANAVAASGTVTITDGKAKLDAAGNEEIDAKTLVANIWVKGVDLISVVVAGFVQTADAAANGKKQVTFDRIDAKLKTATQVKAATFSTAGDKIVAVGGATRFTAKKIDAQGDAAAIQQLLTGVQNNIKNLPEDVQSAITLIDEFKVNGSGQIDLSNVDVSKGGKGVNAKSNVHSELKVPGVGKVVVDIKGFVADVQKASTDVAFDEFHAVLSSPTDQELARFGVVVSAAADPTAGTAAADPHHARIESTGEQKNRDNLFAAINKNVATLPPQVDTAIHLLQAGTTATADLGDVDLKSKGGKLVARGDASFAVDVPNIGHVDLKIKGRDKADGADVNDMAGFKSLVLEVRAATPPAGGQSAPAAAPASSDPIASMEVLGGAVKQDKSFHADSFSVKGNGSLIASLLSDQSRSLFPAEVAQWLGLFDKNQLKQGSGANLNVTTGTDGSLTTSVDNLTIDGAINLHDATGHTYVVPNALLTFKTAKLKLNAAHTAEVVDATTIDVGGDFTYESPTSTVTGHVTAHSNSLHAEIAPGALITSLQGLAASGEVKSNKRKGAPARQQGQQGQQGQQAGQPPPAGQDGGAAAAGASLVKIVNLTTFTPVKAGSYGTTFNHITVYPGTMLNIDVHITNGAIASAKVWFSPIPRFDGLFDVDGAHIRPEGQTGVLTADMGNFLTGWLANLLMPVFANDYVGNAKKLPLDLTTLVKTVAEQMAKLPKKTPDGPSIGDIVGAIDIGATGGRGNIQLTTSQDRTIAGVIVQKGTDIYLTGAAAGGAAASVFLTANADIVKAQAADYAIDATGLSIGAIDAAKSGDKVKFNDLRIASLNLSGVKPPDGAVQKHEGGAQQVSDDDVPRVAAIGVDGTGAPLPHADAIQRSFGRHDVSGIRAQVGGTAELASRAIGAEAYAIGDRIAFASAPDLRLAAHEAAHVIQQQSGVHLSGGVGHAGDRFEQHADAVADAVVWGASAQELLDAFPSGDGSRAVQKADAPVGATPAPSVDLRSLGINIDDPLGVKGALTPMSSTDDDRVRTWMSQHRADILITVAMPDLIRRVRRELGPTSPTIVTASNEDLLSMIHAGAAALQLPLPKEELPTSYTTDEVKAAASQGMSIDASFSVTEANGHFNIVALGKTPDVPRDGVQVVVDPSGATLNTKDGRGNTTAISVDTSLGVKFSTNMGPIAFSAGINANQWQVGLAFGPDVPQLSTLPGVFSNAQHAVSVAAKNISSGSMTKPEALYESIKPHLPAIREALSTAQAAAKPGKVSVGVKVTGPGYAQNQAEGAVQGITVMATLSVTF